MLSLSERDIISARPSGWTGLRDIEGRKILVGHKLRIEDLSKAVWIGEVIFDDGVFTVDLNPILISNPPNWNQPHDWTKSRWWSTVVGYGEFGDWNAPRKSLTSFLCTFKDYKDELDPLYKKYGFLGGRIVNARIVT